jgi:hypothetical protein
LCLRALIEIQYEIYRQKRDQLTMLILKIHNFFEE